MCSPFGKSKYPPKIHFFLWLLSHNKILTRDNLTKRRPVEDKTCVFCSENESVHHLFFDCVVAKQMWTLISQTSNVHINYYDSGRAK